MVVFKLPVEAKPISRALLRCRRRSTPSKSSPPWPSCLHEHARNSMGNDFAKLRTKAGCPVDMSHLKRYSYKWVTTRKGVRFQRISVGFDFTEFVND